MSEAKKSLYERLGGYDAITAVANDLLPRLQTDPQLGRFWAHRGEDGVKREKQLLIDFLCAGAGGPMYYRGRDMGLAPRPRRPGPRRRLRPAPQEVGNPRSALTTSGGTRRVATYRSPRSSAPGAPPRG